MASSGPSAASCSARCRGWRSAGRWAARASRWWPCRRHSCSSPRGGRPGRRARRRRPGPPRQQTSTCSEPSCRSTRLRRPRGAASRPSVRRDGLDRDRLHTHRGPDRAAVSWRRGAQPQRQAGVVAAGRLPPRSAAGDVGQRRVGQRVGRGVGTAPGMFETRREGSTRAPRRSGPRGRGPRSSKQPPWSTAMSTRTEPASSGTQVVADQLGARARARAPHR